MTSLPSSVDVVVVGGGVSGLRAAGVLSVAGIDVLVIEKSDAVGGRVRTDEVDGLLLDRGFQLINPAYPELRRAVALGALDLRPFTPGLVVVDDGRRHRLADPRRKPAWTLDTLRAPYGSLAGRARTVAYALAAQREAPPRLLDRRDTTSAEALADAGVPADLVSSVLRPFLSGVFLEDDLHTSRHFLDLVLRSFMRGTPSVPARGMRVLPEVMAAALPSRALITGVEVERIRGDVVATSAGTVRTRAVVVATDGSAAASLLGDGGPAEPEWRGVTTWYHLADVPGARLQGGEPVLVVDARARGPLVNSVVVSAASPAYATRGRTLVASSALGADHESAVDGQVRDHLAVLHGVPTERWELVARHAIPHALPAMPVPLRVRRDARLGGGRYLCGDHHATSSLQGALVSGRHAAEAVLADLGARRSGEGSAGPSL